MAQHKRTIYLVSAVLVVVTSLGIAWAGPSTHRVIVPLLSMPIVLSPPNGATGPIPFEVTQLWCASLFALIVGVPMIGVAIGILLPQNNFYVNRVGRVMHALAGLTWMIGATLIANAATLSYFAFGKLATSTSPMMKDFTASLDSYDILSLLGFATFVVAGLLMVATGLRGFSESSAKAMNVHALPKHRILMILSIMCVLGFVICITMAASTAQTHVYEHYQSTLLKPDVIAASLLSIIRSTMVAGLCVGAFGLLQVVAAVLSPRDVHPIATSNGEESSHV